MTDNTVTISAKAFEAFHVLTGYAEAQARTDAEFNLGDDSNGWVAIARQAISDEQAKHKNENDISRDFDMEKTIGAVVDDLRWIIATLNSREDEDSFELAGRIAANVNRLVSITFPDGDHDHSHR